jgi:hypothetical protein
MKNLYRHSLGNGASFRTTRRQTLQAVAGGTVGSLLGSSWVRSTATAQEAHYDSAKPSGESSSAAMQERTGAVRLFFSGDKVKPKSPEEIRKIGESIEFFEDGTQVIRHDQAAIAYTPRPLVSNATAELLLQGSLVGKFTVYGTPPEGYPREEGSYYVWVDYLDDRWVGRFVGSATRGEFACVGPENVREEHSRPKVNVHPFGADLGLTTGAPQAWTEYQVSWDAVGSACITTTVCAPTT